MIHQKVFFPNSASFNSVNPNTLDPPSTLQHPLPVEHLAELRDTLNVRSPGVLLTQKVDENPPREVL